MRKLLILTAVIVLLLSGCTEEKINDENAPEKESMTTQAPSKAQAQEEPEQTDDQSQTQNTEQPTEQPAEQSAEQPTVQPKDNAAAAETKQELQELESLLKELSEGEFGDLEFSE